MNAQHMHLFTGIFHTFMSLNMVSYYEKTYETYNPPYDHCKYSTVYVYYLSILCSHSTNGTYSPYIEVNRRLKPFFILMYVK